MKPRLDQIKATTTLNLDTLADLPQQRPKPVDPAVDSKPFIPPRVTITFVRIFEAFTIAAAGVAQLAFYPGFAKIASSEFYVAIIGAVVAAFLAAAQHGGLYRLDALLNPLRSVSRLAVIWVVVAGAMGLGVLLLKMGVSLSRGWYVSWVVSGLGWIIVGRYCIAAVVRHFNANGQLNRRAVIVGGGEQADQAVRTLQSSRNTGISILGFFDDRMDGRSPSETQGLQKLGSVEDLLMFVRSTRVDTLIVTIPVSAEDRLLQIFERLWILPVDIKLSAQAQKLRYRPRAYSYIGNLALLDVFDKPLGEWGPLLKAVEDKLIAAVALVLLAPVMAAVALAIKLDSRGPALFKQKRYGFNNELIEVYKFRSMHIDATDAEARKLVSRGDPRVTRVGRIIRKATLDELPQLFNVLKGELSLVGPRPHATKASAAGMLYENAVQGYFARHKVKPGMTGWAQINGWRGETDTEDKIRKRVEHDLHYIENWSLTFDLYILARTPLALLNTENAF